MKNVPGAEITCGTSKFPSAPVLPANKRAPPAPPDVQSDERPPIRGLISLDIKQWRGDGGERSEGAGIDSACKMRGSLPFSPPAVLISGRRSVARSSSRVTLRLLIRTVDRTAKRRRARKSEEGRDRGGGRKRGRQQTTRDENERSGGRTGGRASGCQRGPVHDQRACLAGRTASGGLVPPAFGQLLLLLRLPLSPPVQFPVLISTAVHAIATISPKRFS